MRGKTYKCDDCPNCAEFSSYVKARLAGWAVSKDYKHVYCPTHAPNHRNGGANKERHNVPDGSGVQLNLLDTVNKIKVNL